MEKYYNNFYPSEIIVKIFLLTGLNLTIVLCLRYNLQTVSLNTLLNKYNVGLVLVLCCLKMSKLQQL